MERAQRGAERMLAAAGVVDEVGEGTAEYRAGTGVASGQRGVRGGPTRRYVEQAQDQRLRPLPRAHRRDGRALGERDANLAPLHHARTQVDGAVLNGHERRVERPRRPRVRLGLHNLLCNRARAARWRERERHLAGRADRGGARARHRLRGAAADRDVGLARAAGVALAVGAEARRASAPRDAARDGGDKGRRRRARQRRPGRRATG